MLPRSQAPPSFPLLYCTGSNRKLGGAWEHEATLYVNALIYNVTSSTSFTSFKLKLYNFYFVVLTT